MADFLLLETGDLILLETGDGILLENQTVVVTGSVATRKTTAVISSNSSADESGFIERGIVYATHISPTTSDTKVLGTGTTGDFDVDITGLTGGTRYYIRAYVIDSRGTTYGDNVYFTTASYKITEKHYIYRVYDSSGYAGTWTQEVISNPTFRSTINGGSGEVLVKLARPFDDFGEGVDITLNNRVQIWCVDEDNPNGLLIYTGYISGYKPIINGVTEYLEVTVLGYIAELQRMILRDSAGNTTLTYNSYDPANILKGIIDQYRALGGSINYTDTSIQLTNTTVSYTFNTNTVKECLDKVLEMCPVGWYWRVDPDNTIYLAPKNIVADHNFNIGLEVEKLETFRRVEDLVNRVLFTGGGSMFRKYENTSSQLTYGLYEKKIVDQRVTDSTTAGIISNREINAKKDPEIRSMFLIVDNSGPQSRGYDIESVKVGQSVKVGNLNTGQKTNTFWDVGLFDVDVYDQTLASAAADIVQVLSVQYSPDSIIVEASSRLPQVAKRIEDINRNLENTQTVNNPVAPS